MWSTRYAPLRLDLKSSPRLAWMVCICHGGALSLLPSLPVPGLTGACLGAAVAAAGAVTLVRHVLLLDARAVRTVIWQGDTDWQLIERGGTRRTVRLAPDTCVHPWMTVLNFRLGRWRRRTVLVLPDRTDADTYRRLRVGLRLYGVRGEG